MGLSEDFNAAAEKVKKISSGPTDDELLELYALFKQAQVGDNTTSKPGMFDLKGKYKWEAWDKKKGLSKDDAMQQYITLANSLVAKYS